MEVNVTGTEFLGNEPKFKTKKKTSSSCVYVLHKSSLVGISRRSRAVQCSDGKEMYRKVCCTCRVVVLLI